MNSNLEHLLSLIPDSYEVKVREQECGYTLVLRRGQAWIFVPAAEYQDTRRHYDPQGMVETIDGPMRGEKMAALG